MKRLILVFIFISFTNIAFAQIFSIAPTSRLENVASRAYINWQFTNGSNQFMTRTMHIARETICSLQIVDWNGYVDTPNSTFTEIGTGAPMILERSVEYPAATVTRVQYSGVNSRSVASNEIITSDVTNISGCIPVGATFYLRAYYTDAAGITYSSRASTTLGDCAVFAPSGVANQVMSTTVTGCAGGGFAFPPVAIVAQGSHQSWCNVGTSRTYGNNDVVSAVGNGDVGVIARSIGQDYAYINMGVASDKASFFITSNSKRSQIINTYCTHVSIELGTNDTQNATLQTNLLSIYKLYSALHVYGITIEGEATSSDNWATLANQTISVDYSATNTFVLGKPSPLYGVFNIASILSRSGKWITNSIANWCTSDGIHESFNCNILLQRSGVVP